MSNVTSPTKLPSFVTQIRKALTKVGDAYGTIEEAGGVGGRLFELEPQASNGSYMVPLLIPKRCYTALTSTSDTNLHRRPGGLQPQIRRNVTHLSARVKPNRCLSDTRNESPIGSGSRGFLLPTSLGIRAGQRGCEGLSSRSGVTSASRGGALPVPAPAQGLDQRELRPTVVWGALPPIEVPPRTNSVHSEDLKVQVRASFSPLQSIKSGVGLPIMESSTKDIQQTGGVHSA